MPYDPAQRVMQAIGIKSREWAQSMIRLGLFDDAGNMTDHPLNAQLVRNSGVKRVAQAA
jgi:hypothetical protein